MKELHIAKGFTLPIEAVAQTFGLLAQRGAGKSNAAVVMAEEMWEAGIPWVAIDPKGDWYGVRSSRDGKKPGLELPVFGGLHGDMPLHTDGGALLADLVIDERLTCVVDVSEFTKSEQRRFLVDFADRLFRRQRRSPEPMHLFLEEAHEYLPQRVMRDEAVLVGLWSRIVKQGRSFGLGMTVISQRSASLNKDVLTQVGTLMVLRTTSPQDRKAIKDWVEEYDVDKEMLSSLSALDDGEAWVWSPQFLRVFKRIKFRQRSTFDSGATPKLGQVRKPATIADIDLASLEKKWSASIERAKEEDPRELKKRVRELERQIALAPDATKEVEVQVPVPYVPEHVKEQIIKADSLLGDLRFHISKFPSEPKLDERPRQVSSTRKAEVPRPAPTEAGSTRLPAPVGELSGMQRKILTVLAQHPERTVEQLLLLTGYRVGGAWNTAMSRLRSSGYIEGSPVKITPAGRQALGDYTPLPTGPELRAYWKNELGQMAAKIIDTLWERDRAMSVDELLNATGYRVGGAWNTAMSRLRKLNIIAPGHPISFTAEFVDATS